MDPLLTALFELHDAIRDGLRRTMARQEQEVWSRQVRDDAGDTVFGLDLAAEDVLLPWCERFARERAFVLVAEGIEPARGRTFGRAGPGGPDLRLIVDPVDGTRGLMYDKRSAWCLSAWAPESGDATRLTQVSHAVQSELPTTRMGVCDRLWTTRGGGAHGERLRLHDGSRQPLPVVPSQRSDFLHGFASVVNFFQGGKELTARIDEALVAAERGGWNATKAEVYTDQYICSGGMLANLALGRDRFVLDLRPWVHRALGITSSLCSKPYDVCTALIAQVAGCIVTAPDGAPLDPPLDITTNVAMVGYANPALAARVQPMLERVLREHGVL